MNSNVAYWEITAEVLFYVLKFINWLWNTRVTQIIRGIGERSNDLRYIPKWQIF